MHPCLFQRKRVWKEVFFFFLFFPILPAGSDDDDDRGHGVDPAHDRGAAAAAARAAAFAARRQKGLRSELAGERDSGRGVPGKGQLDRAATFGLPTLQAGLGAVSCPRPQGVGGSTRVCSRSSVADRGSSGTASELRCHGRRRRYGIPPWHVSGGRRRRRRLRARHGEPVPGPA